MAKLQVVGMDPSLRNWGMVRGTFDTETKQFLLPNITTIKTTSRQAGRGVAKNSLDIEDAESLLTEAYPFAKGADIVCIECPIGSQSADGMKAYGICVALIACLKCAGLEVIITTPLQGKAVVTGVFDAKANNALNVTKKEVIHWVASKHPETPLPKYKRNGEFLLSLEASEHVSDAVIALYAGLNQGHPIFSST